MHTMEIMRTPRIRIRAEEPEHWRDYLEKILGDFPEVRQVRLIAAEAVHDGMPVSHMASIMAIYLGGPSTTHRMRRLRLTLRRIFPERGGKPVRFTIVAASPRGRAKHGLMGRIMEKGACLYKV